MTSLSSPEILTAYQMVCDRYPRLTPADRTVFAAVLRDGRVGGASNLGKRLHLPARVVVDALATLRGLGLISTDAEHEQAA